MNLLFYLMILASLAIAALAAGFIGLLVLFNFIRLLGIAWRNE